MNNGNGKVEIPLRGIPSNSKVCVITVCAEVETINSVSSVAAQLFTNPTTATMRRYLPQNQDLSIFEEMQNADFCVCIIDFDLDRDLAIETVTSFQQLLGAKVMSIAVSRKSSAGLIIDAMRAGCVEYLNKPVEREQLTQAIIRLRLRWTPVHAAAPTGQVLAFLGARGGAGTTTIAIHLATFLVQLCGKKTLIIDQQRQLGHVALYMGLPTPKYHFYDLVRNVERLDEDLLRGFLMRPANGVDVIAAPDELFALTEATLDEVHQTHKFLRGVYEYILIDCPHGLGRLNVATIDDCDKLFLVATPDIPALRDLSRYVDRLSQYHFPPGKLNIAINRFRSKGEVRLEEIEKAVRQPVAVTIPNSSVELIAAMNSGKPLGPGGNSEFSRQIRKWATGLTQSGNPMRLDVQPKPKRSLAFWS
ncbi:MAG: AAA family ATPase [Candidatus Korobacteraceae bacterium]